ncbi:hypothetical protein MMC34_005872 [Xylographa carneopallida]|nr:hypothetical protein [Xylographa carneopallida]
MEERQAHHRDRRHKRPRSSSVESAKGRPDSDRDSYRDRDRGDYFQNRERYNHSPRSHYRRNSPSRSPYRLHSHHQRSASPDSSKNPKRPSPHHDGGQHRSKRRHPSTPTFPSIAQHPRETYNRPLSPPRRSRRRSHSPNREVRKYSTSPVAKGIPSKRAQAPLPSQKAAFNVDKAAPSAALITTEKQKPNFAPSGLLAAETNIVANTAIILKYNEPPESRLPPVSASWRLYVFKGTVTLNTLSLHTRSCWLFGRESAVVDYVTEHPSCSKQHAVVQFRYVEKKDEFGEKVGNVKPYVLDLESANGTRVNGEMVPERRYVELMSGDVLKFGESTREYVLILPPKE